tara:strand:- start:1246 stop:2658 length:1413 start_codon:yes stop_codon:yes gene_type:complete
MMLNRTPPLLYALLYALLGTSTALLAQAGQSTFGHARARELAALGKLPTSSDIVVRDIVNYRRHLLPLPTANDTVSLDVRSDRGGAGAGGELWLQVGYATRSEGDRALSPPCAVTLVVDCSGSMQERGKMSRVHDGLRAFVDRMRPNDQIAVVAFAKEARVVTPLRRRGTGDWLQETITGLRPGGGTNLHAGLMLGIQQLDNGDLGKLTKRVVLLTDGIANEGVTQSHVIATDARQRAQDSIDISTIGVGQNLDTGLLTQLAKTNRGLFHFVADEVDVAKVFVHEADSLLVPAARNVELQIELPRGIASAQVIGGNASVAGQTIHMQMPNLNAGVTGVVMLRCKLAERARGPLTVAAKLLFEKPNAGRTQRRARVRANTELWVDREPEAVATDHEVRKNAAIAVLAHGLSKMAKHSDARRWSDASRVLRRAREEAQRLFPGVDVDVQRVREIAKGHQATLRGYVDRFRNL